MAAGVDPEYALALDPHEVRRYRMMAEQARATEAEQWRAAGIGPGARVADVGCGPGALLPVLAGEVGPGGEVAGVDADATAVAAARAYTADLGHVSVREGTAEPRNGRGKGPGDGRQDEIPAGRGFDPAHCRCAMSGRAHG